MRRAAILRYGRGAPDVDVDRKGKQGTVVQRNQQHVFVGFRAPRTASPYSSRIHFSSVYGVPHFTVQAEPVDAVARLDKADEALMAADDALRAAGFQTNRQYWSCVHGPDEYLEAADVPERLLELIEQDVPMIFSSGILDADYREPEPQPRRRRFFGSGPDAR